MQKRLQIVTLTVFSITVVLIQLLDGPLSVCFVWARTNPAIIWKEDGDKKSQEEVIATSNSYLDSFVTATRFYLLLNKPSSSTLCKNKEIRNGNLELIKENWKIDFKNNRLCKLRKERFISFDIMKRHSMIDWYV